MVDKNLSDELENLESLKEKKFRIFGMCINNIYEKINLLALAKHQKQQ